MNVIKALLVWVSALVALTLSSAPVLAVSALVETDAEISDLADDALRYDLPPFLNCAEDGTIDSICGDQGAGVICAHNGLMAMAGENGDASLRRHMPKISRLMRAITAHADYLEELVEAGEMDNPATMPLGEMRAYCRRAGATVWP